MKKPIRIALADDHPLYLEGLEMLLNSSGEAKVVAKSNEGNAALQMIASNDFDILLLDLHIPGKSGMEIAEELKKQKVNFNTIMLTMQRGGRYMDKLKKLGVKGYLLKSLSMEELMEAVRTVHNGGEVFPHEAKEYDHEEALRLRSSAILVENPDAQLTEREKEILILVCKEFSSAEIGKKLFISTGTVDTHRKNILMKLGVTNTVGLVKYALKHGLLEE
ncbi:MAG TPA: response regulator transcription factor [Bacteroidia bacterium]|jgi:DNA-binding NarL/FixJ family response regulator|nr:response regulator transcription factor [Bacteroidia bacterium]